MNWDPFQREILAELGHVVYRQATVAMAEDKSAAPGSAPRSGLLSMDDTMLVRIAHAANMSTEALASCLAEAQVVTTGLRGDASAKRALWPRLRALRRRQA